MKVPFFELKRIFDDQSQEIQAEVNKVLESGWYIMGSEDQAFERALGEQLGIQSELVVSCNSGTDAIVLGLKAAGVKDGDEVITVSHTAVPTVTACFSVTQNVKLVDIHPQTWVLDPKALQKEISKKTKVIIPVHLYGNMVDIQALKEMLKKIGREDIKVLEDVAQAHGSTLNGKQAGTLGDFGAFSFYPSKNLGALGDAGCVVAKSKEDADTLRMLKNYGQKSRYEAVISGGLNSRLDEIQAAILRIRLKKFDEWNNKKEKLMSDYQEALKQLPLYTQQVTPNCKPAWHLCVVATNSKLERDEFKDFLDKAGVQTIIHYPTPNHLQKAFKDKFKNTKLPNTEVLAERILSLPFNAFLNEDEIQYTLDQVKLFFEHEKKHQSARNG